MAKRKLNFDTPALTDCWYCVRDMHRKCTGRFPVDFTYGEQHECKCWVWAGRPRVHSHRTQDEDDAVINALAGKQTDD